MKAPSSLDLTMPCLGTYPGNTGQSFGRRLRSGHEPHQEQGSGEEGTQLDAQQIDGFHNFYTLIFTILRISSPPTAIMPIPT